MMRLRPLLALLAAGTSPATVAPAEPPQAQRRASALAAAPRTVAWTRTEALARQYVASGKAPGIVIAIGRGDAQPTIIADGRIATAADARRVDGDTLWRVYSMTKPVTAMAAMILVEEGKLKLDQPVAQLIPAFASMRVLTAPDTSLASRPAARPITVRHLMTHTAGLGYNIITTGPLKAEYEKRGIIPAAVNPAVETTLRKTRAPSLQAFADRTGALPLIADPGTRWSYSIGLDVLGRVIEVASGMPFDRFVQQRIFAPLGMDRSYWTVPGDQTGNFVVNYTFLGDRLVPLDPAQGSVYTSPPSFPYGGAGLVMSARDYDRFLAMILNRGTGLNGRRVLKPETVALATSNLLPAGVNFPGIGQGTGGTREMGGFGAGGSVYLSDLPAGPRKGTYGWGGAAGTIGYVDAASGLRVTVMVNYFPGERWPLRQESTRAIYADLAAATR